MKVTKLRSLLKAISWRIVGTLKIGTLELFTKFILYYIHERIWLRSNFGTKK